MSQVRYYFVPEIVKSNFPSSSNLMTGTNEGYFEHKSGTTPAQFQGCLPGPLVTGSNKIFAKSRAALFGNGSTYICTPLLLNRHSSYSSPALWPEDFTHRPAITSLKLMFLTKTLRSVYPVISIHQALTIASSFSLCPMVSVFPTSAN